MASQTRQTPYTDGAKSPATNVNTRSVPSPAFGITAFATVRVSPAAYPLPAVVTVTLVTVLPLMTAVNLAPVPLPLDVVAKLVSVPSVASVGFVVMLASNSSAVVLSAVVATNPLQY